LCCQKQGSQVTESTPSLKHHVPIALQQQRYNFQHFVEKFFKRYRSEISVAPEQESL